MKSTNDFVSQHTKNTYFTQLLAQGSVRHGKRASFDLALNYEKNLFTEPVLMLNVKDVPDELKETANLFNIVNSVSLYVNGQRIDDLNYVQINIFQHKHNIKPLLNNDKIIFPLPFNCMLKENGFFLVGKNNRANIVVQMSDSTKNEINKYIDDGCIYINASKIDENFDMSEMTNYYYKKMTQTKYHKNDLLKINNSYPSDYVSYYLIENLLKSKVSNTNNFNANIYASDNLKLLLNQSVQTKQSVQSTESTESTEFVDQLDQLNQLNQSTQSTQSTQSYDKCDKSLSVPVGLIEIKQNQFMGFESTRPKYMRHRLYFNHDIESIYFCGIFNDTVCQQKWFGKFILQINGYDVMEYNYESLYYYNTNSNLPVGVFELPNFNKTIQNLVNAADCVILLFNEVNLQESDQNEFLFFACAESKNYITVGPQMDMVFC
jgi:hypothetical protein